MSFRTYNLAQYSRGMVWFMAVGWAAIVAKCALVWWATVHLACAVPSDLDRRPHRRTRRAGDTALADPSRRMKNVTSNIRSIVAGAMGYPPPG